MSSNLPAVDNLLLAQAQETAFVAAFGYRGSRPDNAWKPREPESESWLKGVPTTSQGARPASRQRCTNINLAFGVGLTVLNTVRAACASGERGGVV